MVELDYLVVGHATRDVRGGTFTVGGTVAYAAWTARALGCRVGVITSTGPDLDLSDSWNGILITHFEAPETTTFENTTVDGRRRQVIHGTASPLTPTMVPRDWRPAIAHIGPVAQECDPALVSVFEEAFVGVTPQGWMRQWDERGRVSRCSWKGVRQKVLPQADAVVMSEEDIGRNEGLAAEYAAQTTVLAVTQGPDGCIVYTGGETRRFAPSDVTEVDPTGAGDVFAASFFYALQQGHGPGAAARFANYLAARSVTRVGLSGVPTMEEVAHCERAMLGEEANEPDEAHDAHHLRAG